MRRRLPAIVAILLIAVAGGALGGWLWLTASVRAAIEGWAAQQRAVGYEVEWQQLDVSGPPWRITSHIDGAKIGRQDGNRPWSWSPPPLALDVLPLHLDEFGLAGAGLHRLDVTVDGRRHSLIVTAVDAIARVKLDGQGELAGIAGRAQNLELSVVDEPLQLRAATGEIAFERPALNGAGAGMATGDGVAPQFVAIARFDGVVLPIVPTGPFGQTVELISGEGMLRGVVPDAPPAEALEAWRAAGGTIELARFELIWGPLRAVADGTLALDGELQPIGALVARVRGLIDAIDALERLALVDARTAAFARLAVAALSRAPADGGAPELRVPVTIQDRRLSLGPVALLTLPRLRWR